VRRIDRRWTNHIICFHDENKGLEGKGAYTAGAVGGGKAGEVVEVLVEEVVVVCRDVEVPEEEETEVDVDEGLNGGGVVRGV
jgi:hypothetical protein